MPLATPAPMIQCPGCGRTLPNGAVRCQFCGADLSNVARPRAAAPARKVKGPPTYIMTLYHVGAGWWILQGGRTVAVSLGILPEMMSALGGAFAGFVIVAIIIGAIQALLGIGLMAKIELARGIVNVLCWINILLGLYSFIFLFGMVLVFPLAGILGIILNVIDIVVAGAMIWLIGETETWR